MNPAAPEFEACRRETRRLARNFHAGMRLTPEPGFSALCAVYLWMAAADDLADGEARPAERRRSDLAAFRRATEAAFRGDPPADGDGAGFAHWPAFRATLARFPLPPEAFAGVLDGQLADLDFTQPADETELDRYCHRVASTVGRVCVAVWGGEPAETDALADARGVALQRTNILRDLTEDAARGRVYLPADALARHGVAADDLRGPATDAVRRARVGALLEEQIARARERFDASTGLEALLPRESRASSRVIAGVYRRLLDRIAADPLAVLERRVRVPAAAKLRVVGGAWLRAKLRR